MHPTDLFQVYNVFVGVLSATGFVYLASRNRSTRYQQFAPVLVFGLVVFVVGGPIVDLVAPSWSHVVHSVAALFVIFGLYNPVANDLRRVEWGRLILRDATQLREPADWMVPMDDEILELFHSSHLVLTPAIIAYNTGYSREEVNRRLRELSEAGLVDRVERGKYSISPVGEAYLAGIDPETQQNPERVARPH